MTRMTLALVAAAALLWPAAPVLAQDGGYSIRGRFTVTWNLRDQNNELRQAKIENVETITFAGNFILLELKGGGLALDRTAISNLKWTRMKSGEEPAGPPNPSAGGDNAALPPAPAKPVSEADRLIRAGMAKFQKRQLREAIADFTKALSLEPENAEALLQRGNARVTLREFEAGIADFDKALKIKPDASALHLSKGVALFNMGRRSDALASVDEACRLGPSDANAFFQRGNMNTRMGRNKAACADFTKTIELKPKFALAYVNRAMVYQRLGDPDAAQRDWQAAARLDPKLVRRLQEQMRKRQGGNGQPAQPGAGDAPDNGGGGDAFPE